jgi:hypothetical protein
MDNVKKLMSVYNVSVRQENTHVLHPFEILLPSLASVCIY